ncbi:MAG: hypothetical protein ACRDLL_17420 [Solirubrobacterales bacterium]
MRAVLAALPAFLAGVLIGHVFLASPTTPPPHADPHPGDTRPNSGVGVGETHTSKGAALAAARYQQLFAEPTILRPGALARRARWVATAAFAPVMVRANRPGANRLAEGAFGEGLREGVQSAFFAVPLAYRVLSYAPERAVVRTWGFTLLGNAASVSPSAYFGLARTVLIWVGGRWRIANTRASFGPTPRLLTPPTGEGGVGVLDLAHRLHRYDVAP